MNLIENFILKINYCFNYDVISNNEKYFIIDRYRLMLISVHLWYFQICIKNHLDRILLNFSILVIKSIFNHFKSSIIKIII